MAAWGSFGVVVRPRVLLLWRRATTRSHRPPLVLLPMRKTHPLRMYRHSLHTSGQPIEKTSSAHILGDGPTSLESSEMNAAVKQALEQENILLPSYKKQAYWRVMCPKCEGGARRERSLVVNIANTGEFAMWSCQRKSCLFSGTSQRQSNMATDQVAFSRGKKTLSQDAHMRQSNLAAKDDNSHSPTHADHEEASDGEIDRDVEKEQEGSQYVDSSDQAKLCAAPALTVSCSKLAHLSQEAKLFFSARGISESTLERNKVKQKVSKHGLAMVFPYFKDEIVVNLKYRTLKKLFWQEKNALKVFYGLDDVKTASDIIIVEGEIDKLSMEEAGFINCVSVPDGAPPKASDSVPPSESEDKKYSYIWNSKEYFEKAKRIILATDADEPGQALANELARRLGRERCWRVNWPKTNGKVCKDANEVLMKLGEEALCNVVQTAEPYPIRGLFTFSNFYKDLDDYYHVIEGNELGVSTGWEGLDEFYKVVPGELTLVTGVPSSGKSEWIDAVMCNLVELRGWSFGLCSMENKVREHARKLLEKHLRKPFFDGVIIRGLYGTHSQLHMHRTARYANNVARMSHEDLQRGKRWLNDNFYLIRCEDDQLPSIDWVLQLAKAAVTRHGIRGLVIDPYNELDHQRGPSQTETEYISQMLTKIKRFAQHHSCHVWFVAHPRQMQAWTGEAPNLYDISGSAHFMNKCDNGIVVHRNRDSKQGPVDQVKVLVRKVRNKAAGTIGEASLFYDRVTGLYSDLR